MPLETEAYEGELEMLRKYHRLIKHTVMAEKFGGIYFICGESGTKDQNNLPEYIHICPAYGVDWIQLYKRTDQTAGPEW